MVDQKTRPKQKLRRPDIFKYHDFRAFLKDWLLYLRSNDPNYSMRTFARNAGISISNFSMILKGTRSLTLNGLMKLIPQLQLDDLEQSYFENLVKMAAAASTDARVSTVNRMSSFAPYQKHHPNEFQIFQYFNRWYHLAIREMASLPGFKADPEWIQRRLKIKLPLQTIREALEFLIMNRFLQINSDGTATSSSGALKCVDRVYQAAQIQFHREMFRLATESIENTSEKRRNLEGMTFPISAENYEKVAKIVKTALDEIEALANTPDPNVESIYQVQVALFPLTKEEEKK